MLVGHLAVGLGAKRIEPRLSLGALVGAAMLADFLWAILTIAGLERMGIVPGVKLNRLAGIEIAYSHSFAMDILWAALAGAGYVAWRRYLRGAWIIAAAVASHWVLDVISHRPDMPLAPGIDKVFGLGLWNSFAATAIVEGGLWTAAVVWYARGTRPRSRVGIYAFWPAVVLLTLSSGMNLPAPPPADAVRGGVASLIFFSLIVGWALWMERVRFRRPVEGEPRGSSVSAAPPRFGNLPLALFRGMRRTRCG